MAKMFYTLDEASQRLGMSPEQIKELAANGKLQQFRDRDKLMFKREQVDTFATADESLGGSSLGIPLSDPGPDDTDAINLADSLGGSGTGMGSGSEDPREATGISVFDAGEIEPADPMAQTQVTQPQIDDEELALESVGSGSGLLDLTRESDDTSLGAELLEEIYPSGGDTGGGSSADFGLESSVGSSGVFEGSLLMETGTAGTSGIAQLSTDSADVGSMDMPVGQGMGTQVQYGSYEESDPAGSALGAGLLAAASIALILALIVVIAAVAGTRSAVVTALVSDGSAMGVLYLALGLAVLAGVLGGGMMVLAKRA